MRRENGTYVFDIELEDAYEEDEADAMDVDAGNVAKTTKPTFGRQG